MESLPESELIEKINTLLIEQRRNRTPGFEERKNNIIEINEGTSALKIKNISEEEYEFTYIEKNKEQGTINTNKHPSYKKICDYYFGRDLENNQFPNSPVTNHFRSHS